MSSDFLPPLCDDEVHLWAATINVKKINDYQEILTLDELNRADRFHFQKDHNRFIYARAVLRLLLGKYLNKNAEELNFEYSARGKPSISNDISLHFNISHSEQLIVYAFSKHPIGVDIELIKPDRDEGIAKRFFSSQENNFLELLTGTEKTRAFYDIWARKEAVLKAVGEGLFLPLNSFSVSPDKNKEQIKLMNVDWWIESFTVDPQFASAIACNHEVKRIVMHQWIG